MTLENIETDQTIKLNTYPRKIDNCTILSFTGKQLYYGDKVPNKYAFYIKDNTVNVYHRNAIGSYTAVDYHTLPIPLVKEIAKYI